MLQWAPVLVVLLSTGALAPVSVVLLITGAPVSVVILITGALGTGISKELLLITGDPGPGPW